MNTSLDAVTRLADLIRQSPDTVVLAGAGLSTESGIPDFRSPKSGLYHKFSPEIFSIDRFDREPAYFYSFAAEWFARLQETGPNRGHTAMARLMERGWIKTVITQNIDGYEAAAGCHPVLEIHGHLRRFFCRRCGDTALFPEIASRLQHDCNPPRCKKCNTGIYKPAVVFFGEQLPLCFADALQAAKAADLILVLGSSLTVQPAASLPLAGNAKLAIINLQPTPYDDSAEITVRQSLGEILEKLEQHPHLSGNRKTNSR